MTCAVIVVTGAQPAAVHVTDSTRIEAEDHRGWESRSIEYFIDKGLQREFVLGDHGRIEVQELPKGALSLDPGPNCISSDTARAIANASADGIEAAVAAPAT